jgi:hypothetical protein
MANPTYSVADLVDKTITAASRVDVYRHAQDSASPAYSVGAGQPIGTLFSWLDADGTLDRAELWFMYYDSNNVPFYTKWGPGLYNFDILEGQGVQTEQQKAADAAFAALPWYEQLIQKYGPWVLGLAVVTVGIKAYFSRPKSQS